MKFWTTTRGKLGLTSFAMAVFAIWIGEIGAVFVVYFGYSLMVMAHAIEFKINKLLDDRGILVADFELRDD